MFLWSPIIAGYATLHEVATVYTLDDVVDMHIAIAFKRDLMQANEADKS